IIHRRDHFRASKIMLERARKHEKIEFLIDTVVEDVYDVAKKEVTGLKLRNLKSSKVWDFPTRAMFLGIGHEPNAKMFTGQLAMYQDGYVKTRDFVFTNVAGVFACGDVQDRRYRQAITAAGSGCAAAMEAEKFLEGHGRYSVDRSIVASGHLMMSAKLLRTLNAACPSLRWPDLPMIR